MAPAKILLVDDHPANLLALEATLAPLGQCLVRASSGIEALAKLKADSFALVLLDVHMPELDGYETCRKLRSDERTRALPVIFMTAVYNDREHESAGYAVGAVDYITKPFDPAVLKAKVGAFVAMDLQAQQIKHQGEALRAAERATAEEAFARRAAEEANRAKDHFLAVVSHELRTPLNTMLGWTEMLRTGRLDPERSARALDTVVRCGYAQNRLIEDLLDSSRIVAGKMQLRKVESELTGIVDAVVHESAPAAEQRGVQLRFEHNGERCLLDADPHRLRQIIWNLLSNAIKFSREGGVVDIRLQQVGAFARLEVEDSGIGIAADFLPYVFERFRQAIAADTREHGGLGLGLAIVRHLVELHGGTISAGSAGPGLGARFTVELPLDATLAPGSAQRKPSTGRFRAIRNETTDLSHVRVLFVDDEEDTRELVGQMLKDAGASVQVAASVADAVQTLEHMPIDVIVSDLSMPHEDGFSLARRVTAWSLTTGISVPTIALSAYAGIEDRERALEAGFETHIAKPFEPARLLSLISALAPKRPV